MSSCTKYIVDKIKEYRYSYELRYCSYGKEFLRRVVPLEYPNGDIKKKGYQIGNSEKYTYEKYAMKLKCEEEYNRKMKDHPDKSLECIRNVEILKPISVESSIC